MPTECCQACRKVYTPFLLRAPDAGEKLREWKEQDKLIQNVWPDAEPWQREQLISGVCSDICWDTLFAEDD